MNNTAPTFYQEGYLVKETTKGFYLVEFKKSFKTMSELKTFITESANCDHADYRDYRDTLDSYVCNDCGLEA